MLGRLALMLNPKRLVKYSEYFKSDEFENDFGVTIEPKKVLVMGMSNLQHKRYETNTHIFINPLLLYPGTTYRVVDLCKIINFGTLSIEGYPLLSEVFEHFQHNIPKYIDKCIMRGG
jgi:hypothetical protein